LEALRDPRKDSLLRALANFAERVDETGRAEGMSAEQAFLLDSTDCFESNGVAVLLVSDLLCDLTSFRARAPRLLAATTESRARCGDPTTAKHPACWSLCAAQAFFNAGLFFEVHELLEADWRRVTGDPKTILQGLIQVSVGLHHHADGNIRGALTRLRAGNDKLRRFRPAALSIDLEHLCTTIDEIVRRLRIAPAVPIEAPRLVVRQSASESTR
jgi:hypothetical protein